MPIQIKKPLKLKPADYLAPMQAKIKMLESELGKRVTFEALDMALKQDKGSTT